MSTIPIQNLIFDDSIDIGLSNELFNGTYKTSSLTDLSNNVYAKISDLSSNVYTSINTKQSNLTESTDLVGNGSQITALNYNNITTNKPSTFPSDWTIVANKPLTFNPDLTNIYTKSQVDSITTLTNFYTKSQADTRYLRASGANSMTGKLTVLNADALAIPATGISGGNGDRIIIRNGSTGVYPYSIGLNTNNFWFSVPSDGSYSFFMNGSPLMYFGDPLSTITGTLNVTNGLQEAGTDLSVKYLQVSTAASTYATISALDTKENTLSFTSPLTRSTNTIGIDLSGYTLLSSFNTLSTTVAGKENTLSFTSPLTRSTNTIGIDLSAYPLKTYVDSSLNTIVSTKQNNLTFSNPFSNTSNTITLKYNSSHFNIDASGNLALLSTSNNVNASSITSGILSVSYGGTGSTTLTAGQVLIGNGTSALTQSANLSWNNTSNILSATNFLGDGSRLTNINISNVASGALTVSRGGIGTTTLTAGQIIVGNGSNPVSQNQNLTWDNTNNRLGIGVTNPSNILQVGGGGRLRISNGTTDYSLLGTIDTDTSLNTRILISGNTRASNAGNIELYTTSTGSTIFYNGITEIFKILNTGQLSVIKDKWHKSNDGVDRFYYTVNGTTYFHSGNVNGDGFIFRNTEQSSDVFTINDNGNIACTGTASFKNVNITDNNKLTFNDQLNNMKIQLYNGFGFGINDFTLRYTANTDHKFYAGATNTATIDGSGNFSCSGIATISNFVNINGVNTSPQSLSFRSQAYNIGISGATGQYSTWASQNDMTIRTLTGTKLILQCGVSGGALCINSFNNIGIGTNNPSTRLHIEHASTSANGANGGLYLYNPNNIANHCSILGLRIGGSTANRCGISLDVTGAYGWNIGINGSDTGSKMIRFNDSWDNSGTDRMTLDYLGNLVTTGDITTGSDKYLYAGGLRIGGWDGNTLYSGNKDIGITFNSGYKFTINSLGVGELVRVNNTGMGFGNTNPKSYMHLGNCDIAGASPVLLFGKRLSTNTGFRTAFIAYDDLFNFCLGDAGNTNNGISSSTLFKQLVIAYNAPPVSLAIGSSGFVSMAYGHTGASDERIKTNIRTIENALDKTLLLRGVNYNDIRIEPDKLRMGLIAQEVELVIPEVVHTDEKTTMKSIEYQNIVGLLVEAIKELNNKVTNLENIIKKNNLN
jgi:hypothetical protein